MAALIVVVDEAIGITETVVVTIVDFAEINRPHLGQDDFYPPTIDVIPLDLPTIVSRCCDEPYWIGAIFMYERGIFAGGEIQISYDDECTWTDRHAYTEESLTGVVVPDASGDRNLGTAIPDHWDVYSQVTVEMTTGGILESRTREEVYAGANQLYINGEIRGFSTAVEIDPIDVSPYGVGRTFVLTDWIRGLHQTPITDPVSTVEIGTDIVVRSFVLDLNGPMTTIPLPIGDDSLELFYRAVDNSVESDPERGGIPITLTGANLKPFTVAIIGITRDVSENASITWDAVTREPDQQILAARGVNDPDATTYTIEILDAPGGAVVRTEDRTTEEFQYPAAIQTIDFGSPQSLIHFTVTRTGTWTDGDAVEGQG